MKKLLTILLALMISLIPLTVFAAGDEDEALDGFEVVDEESDFEDYDEDYDFVDDYDGAEDEDGVLDESIDEESPEDSGFWDDSDETFDDSDEEYQEDLEEDKQYISEMPAEEPYTNDYTVTSKKGAKIYKEPKSTSETYNKVIPYGTKIVVDKFVWEPDTNDEDRALDYCWAHTEYQGMSGWVCTADWINSDREASVQPTYWVKSQARTRNIIIACVAAAVIVAVMVIVVIKKKKSKAALKAVEIPENRSEDKTE